MKVQTPVRALRIADLNGVVVVHNWPGRHTADGQYEFDFADVTVRAGQVGECSCPDSPVCRHIDTLMSALHLIGEAIDSPDPARQQTGRNALRTMHDRHTWVPWMIPVFNLSSTAGTDGGT